MPTRALHGKAGSALRLRTGGCSARWTGKGRESLLRGSNRGGEGEALERPEGDVARVRAARRGWAGRKGGGEGVTLRAGLSAAPASFAELGGAVRTRRRRRRWRPGSDAARFVGACLFIYLFISSGRRRRVRARTARRGGGGGRARARGELEPGSKRRVTRR